MKNAKRMIALVLALILAVSVFTACGENKDEKKDEAAITATAVKFSKDGKYTTTVKSDKYDLSKISAKNVEISYVETSAGVNDDVTLTSVSGDEEAGIQYVKVKVDSVKANSDGGYDITFTDENAALNPTSYYNINFTKLKVDKDDSVSAEVEYPEITLTPDIEFATPSDKKIKVSLALEGSEFEDEISDSNITLDNAFKNMNAKVVSSSEKNLTLELKGKVTKNEAGAYQWGTINVKASAVKDAANDVSSKVDIKLDYAGFDASSLKYSDGKVTADLKVYGVADVSKLTKDNVKVEDATVEAVEKKDDNTLTVTMTAKDITSVNDFVDTVSGKKLTLDGYTTEAALSQSTFYPVFDYVEDDGDNLKLTLKLYSFYGEFDKDIKTSQFSFSDGFKDAKADSVKVDEDGIATLIISVPANGQESESFEINGTVTAAADAFVNAWGEKASKESSYTRGYSNENLGKDDGGISLNESTLLEIQKFTRGKNTIFGSICYWGGVAGQVFSIAKTVLELTGVIKSEHVQVMEKLDEISGKIDGVLENQIKIMNKLDEFGKEQKSIQNDDYKDKIDTLNNNVNIMEDTLKVGALYMALDEAVAKGKLDKIPNFAGLEGDDLDREVKKYQKYLPDLTDMSEEKTYEYTDKLVDYILDQAKDTKIRRFASFSTNNDNLKEALLNVTDKLTRTDGTNPMQRYDELCSMMYNFDSQCYYFRAAQRDTALSLMGRALACISVTEKAFTDPLNPDFKNAKKAVNSAAKLIDEEYIDNLGHAPEDIKAFPHKERVKTGKTYISDIAVGGDPDSGKAKKALTDKGYTVIDQDLNAKAGGHYVYLGYKTTKDYTKAIQEIYMMTSLEKARALNHITPIAAYGESGFVKNKGDLNHEAGGDYIYLGAKKSGWWYTGGDRGAITQIYFNSEKSGSLRGTDLNKSAGGDYIYLHYKFEYDEELTGKTFETDPEYYPYSYVLGKKVAIRTRQQAALDNENRANIKNALKNPDGSYRAWTGEESNEFVKRMGNNTLEQEFKSAGINGAVRNFALDMKYHYKWVFGNYIPLNSNTIKTSTNVANNYGYVSNEGQDKTEDDNFTFMFLNDYSKNKVRKTYLSDIMLSGAETEKEAKKCLTDKEYKVYDTDICKSDSKKFLYIGYKTTTNPDEAITGLKVVVKNYAPADDNVWKSCPTTGFFRFTNDAKGSLTWNQLKSNRGFYNVGQKAFLFYTKDKSVNDQPLTSITINNIADGAVNDIVLNSADDPIYLHGI